jgi:excisionase family DNA binding protein
LDGTTERALLRPSEAREILGVSRSTVYDLIRQKAIPSVRIGGSIRVPRRALLEQIERETTGPAAA